MAKRGFAASNPVRFAAMNSAAGLSEPTILLKLAQQTWGEFMQDICFARTAFSLLLIIGTCFQSSQLNAEGALALGLPSSVAKEGFAFGYSINKETSDQAQTNALDRCRTSEAGSAQGKKLCRVAETFSGKCVAVAMDPKAGTPGVGWSVDADLASAEARAMSHCKATAGADRVDFCTIDKSACDK
ncbi:MAG: DUF4189 domain-containing protein [Hyphomicrobium sp.]|uniref:DUF4189 domain-containing protein n=1 Tax=Hyphomicrobium sp. TaxID=82 RepID=UPI003D0E4B70